MKDILDGIILGLAQGLTEFLPVSSSGHLVLSERAGIGEPSMLTNLLLHLATLLAVLFYYRKSVWEVVRHPLKEKSLFVLTASVPTAGAAALVRFVLPDTDAFLPFFFCVTSVILLLPKILPPKEGVMQGKVVLPALITGLSQGVACFSGISRSGTTTVCLRYVGKGDESAEYSFLLSIPVIIGSSIVEIISSGKNSSVNVGTVLGMIIAFVTGIIAIRFFEKLLKKDKLHYFSIYTFIMAIVAFLVQIFC